MGGGVAAFLMMLPVEYANPGRRRWRTGEDAFQTHGFPGSSVLALK